MENLKYFYGNGAPVITSEHDGKTIHEAYLALKEKLNIPDDWVCIVELVILIDPLDKRSDKANVFRVKDCEDYHFMSREQFRLIEKEFYAPVIV